LTSPVEVVAVDLVEVPDEEVVIACQDGRAVLAHPWQVVIQIEYPLGDHEHLLQVDEHPPGRLRTCLVLELPHGQMAHELSTPTTVAVLRMVPVDARLLGRLVEGLLPLVMPLVLDHVHLRTVEEIAGAQVPRLLLGECLRPRLELVATTHGVTRLELRTRAHMTLLRPALHLVPQLLVQ